MFPYPYARYPPYAYDDTWARPGYNNPPADARPFSYEDDFHRVPRYGPAWPGMQPVFGPLPPSPTMLATLVPLPPSPNISPRLVPVALAPVATVPGTFLHPADQVYVPTTPPANVWRNPRTQVNPLIDGNAPRMDLFLDLSSFHARPLTRTDIARTGTANSLTAIHPGYLQQTATYPPTTRMVITCRELSPYHDKEDWRIVIDPGRQISVGDVIDGVHRSLQTLVSHVEYARLTQSRQSEISRAYTRRSTEAFLTPSEFERNQGVRRVDLLGDHYMFGGLVRQRSDDLVHFELTVRARRSN